MSEQSKDSKIANRLLSEMEQHIEAKKKEPVTQVLQLQRDIRTKTEELDVLHHALAAAKASLTPEEVQEVEMKTAEEGLDWSLSGSSQGEDCVCEVVGHVHGIGCHSSKGEMEE